MSGQQTRNQRHFIYWISVFPGIIFMSLLLWQSSKNRWGQRRFTLFDDAMISMGYARTLASTGEFVWFPGAPRVQGFTNPLWTLWMAAIHRLGFEGSSAALIVSVTGILLILGSAFVIYDLVLTYAHGQKQMIAAFTAASIPFLYPLTFWTLRGMEVGLLTLLCLLLLRATIQCIASGNTSVRFLMILPIVLGIATRFDFIVFCFISVAAIFFWGEQRARVRLAMTYLTIALTSAAIVCLSQKLYWGSWLPNTYHLKMDGVEPLDRILRGAASSMKTLSLFAVIAIALYVNIQAKELHQRLVLLASANFIVMAAYSVYIGGDAWEGDMINRFYATVLPLIPLIIALSFNTIRSRKTTSGLIAAVLIPSVGAGVAVNPFGFSSQHFEIVFAAAIVCSLFILGMSLTQRPELLALSLIVTICCVVSAYPTSQQWKKRDPLAARTNLLVTASTEILRETTTETATIATVWAGVPAYYSQRPMLDLLGKNDVHIATSAPHGSFFPGHNKWDYEYSIGQLQPDVIFQIFDRDLEPNLPARIAQWGYKKWCPIFRTSPTAGDYYRTNSTKIKWDTLKECP
jgi:hypothetical protein